MLVVRALLGGDVAVRLVVDSGAGTSALSLDFFRALGAQAFTLHLTPAEMEVHLP